jgi:hypothetical protein
VVVELILLETVEERREEFSGAVLHRTQGLYCTLGLGVVSEHGI